MLIDERPMFHKGETEIERSFTVEESMLSAKQVQQLSGTALTCYGIGKDVLSFIAKNISKGEKTLETGAGCSTLVFAYCGAVHTAVTPSGSEIELIKKYAAEQEIDMGAVTFVPQSSDYFLPRNEDEGYNMVLLDGKHAFPWPVVDWFYTADKLKKDGLMLIDDAEMRSVSILIDFMNADPNWELVQDFDGKTLAFKKTKDKTLDVAWHMQPYSVVHQSPVKKIISKIKHLTNR